MAQVKPIKILSDGRLSEIDQNLDDLKLKSFTGQTLLASGAAGEKVIVLAHASDSNQNLLSVKNSSGITVAAINEQGNISSRNISASAISASSLTLSGNLTTSGNVTLGNDTSDKIYIYGQLDADLNLGGKKITSLGTPTVSGDAATKGYVDQALSSGGGNFWSLTGNVLDPVTFPNGATLGSQNDQNVYFVRNTTPFISFLNDTPNGNIFLLTHLLTYEFEDEMYFQTRDIDEATHGLNIYTGSPQVSGNSGNLNLGTGNVQGSFNSGTIDISTGTSVSGLRGDINISGRNINLQNNTAITGNLTTSGTITSTGAIQTSGAIRTTSTIQATGAISSSGTISTTSSLSSASGLNVSGNVVLGNLTSNTLTLNGIIQNNLNLGSKKITNLADPSADQEAATKKYVDDQLQTVGNTGWNTTGNNLSAVGTIGSLNNYNVSLVRESKEFFLLAKDNPLGNLFILESVNLFELDNTFYYSSLDIGSTTKSLYFSTGNPAASGKSGDIALVTGDSTDGESGGILIKSGESEVTRGDITLDAPSITVSGNVILGIDSESEVTILGKLISDVNLNDNKITSLGAPTLSGDATNKNYVDTEVSTLRTASVLRDGTQAMTGNLNLNSNKITSLATPTASGDASNKSYVDSEISTLRSASVLRDGTQAMTGNLNLNSNKITSLATPTASGDAANKSYVDSQSLTVNNAKWDKSGNSLISSDVFGSTNDQDVVFIRNNSTKLKIQDAQLEHFSNIRPSANSSFYLGETDKQYTKIFVKEVTNFDNTDFVIKQNNAAALTVNSSDATVDRNLVIQAKVANNETKIFNVKNTSGASVASIDEDGDMIVNNLLVNGVETVVGIMTTQSNLQVQGTLTVSGAVYLGDVSTDGIFFVGRADSNLNMNSNKITSLATPTASGDASNKSYVDSEISTLRTASVLRDGTQSMTGNLNLNSNKIISLGAPTLSGDATNKNYVDTEVSTLRTASVLRDGTQAMTGNLNLGGFKITSLGAPALSGDASNKNYVDTEVSTLRSASMLLNGTQAMTANMSLGGFKITSLGAPTATGDAVNLNYLSSNYSNNTLNNLAATTSVNSSLIPSDTTKNLGTSATKWSTLYVSTIGNDVSHGGFKITSLGAPTLSGDATNKNYVDTEVSTLRTASVLRDGSQAMTGALSFGGFKITSLGAPTLSGDATNKNYVDTEISTLRSASILRDGTQAMTGNLNLGGFKVTSLGAPTLSGDATNKNYVDTEISTLRSASMLLNGTQAMTANMNLGGFKITSLADATASGDAVNKKQLDAQNASLTSYINEVASAVSAVEDLKIPLTASGNIAAGAPVFIVQTANETVREASATGSTASRIIGFAESSITNGSTGNITIAGFAVIPVGQIDGGALTVGSPVFLSANTGKVTSTAPTSSGSRVHQVGVAVSSTKLIIDIKQGITIT